MSINTNLVVDTRKGDPMWNKLQVQVIPLRPKTKFLSTEPNEKGLEALHAYQHKWGTSEKSYPVIMRVPQKDGGVTSELAMVEPTDFLQPKEAIWAFLVTARENNKIWLERSMDFVFTAITGHRPPGSTRPESVPSSV